MHSQVPKDSLDINLDCMELETAINTPPPTVTDLSCL